MADAEHLPDEETLFVRALQRKGLVEPEHLVQARSLQQTMTELGLVPKPLREILVEKGWLDTAEAARVQELVERIQSQFRVPGYKLLKRLGRGSMGTVYKARQLTLDRVVAIKILAPFLAENTAYVRRFLKEARVIGKLNHPNIVQGFDAGESQGTYYYAMEYCEGPTLLGILQRGGAMDQDRVLTIGLQVTHALAHAHHQGLVHRDVKPDNIMVIAGSTAKLCDLGLAKDVSRGSGSTEKGVALGTPNYISPEQARGDAAVDIRSDIYSLGATLYHLVTGVPPFDGPNPAVIMVKHLSEPPVPPRARVPDLDPAFQAIIAKMMAKKPEDRYQTPDDLLSDLESLAESRRLGTPPGSAPPPPGRRRR